jgi:TolB-like protein/Tfp pilus assembly protein PilF
VNMSGDKEQEYFSDGLTEELLNSLSRINELQVAARTSSFSFQGEHPDIATVAHKLNVTAVLEGSVRRSAHTVRITAQLVNAVTGFHVWSRTYDRDLGDVLKLQTEIATAVASALKITLLGDAAAKIEVGGTQDPAAFDAYLRGVKIWHVAQNEMDYKAVIANYTAAIQRDPSYALAYASRSRVLSTFASDYGSGVTRRVSFEQAREDARRAVALAPNLAEAHLAMAVLAEDLLDFAGASGDYEKAVELGHGNARVLAWYGLFEAWMGHSTQGLAALHHAVTLDPLNFNFHRWLAGALNASRRHKDALVALNIAERLQPNDPLVAGDTGLTYYALGNYQEARITCERNPNHSTSQLCLAMTYDKLGQRTDAQAMLRKVLSRRDDSVTHFAAIYAQRGDVPRALDWLDTALHQRDPALEHLKCSELFDPLRREPRFQAIERELRFPN